MVAVDVLAPMPQVLITCGPTCSRIAHVSHYPPGLSAYIHGNCRCCVCTYANTRQRQLQRAGLATGRRRRTLEDRVREAMGA